MIQGYDQWKTASPYDDEAPCEVCGLDPADCKCTICPECGAQPDTACIESCGHHPAKPPTA